MGFPRRKPARPSVRRALIGLVSGGLLLPAALLTATPAAAIAGVSLVSSTSWTEASPVGATHIVGQVRNNTAANVTQVRVNVNLVDAKPNDTWFTYANVAVLGPGEYSPFELLLFPPPAGYSSYTIGTITYAPSVSQPYHSQLASTIGSCVGLPADWVCGAVTNNGTVTVDRVQAVITYLDGSNNAVAVEHPMAENATGGTTLAPSETGHYIVALTPGEPVGTSSLVLAEPEYATDLSSNPLDLGGVNVGKTGQGTVTLFNTGSLPITVSGVQAAPSAEFAAPSNDCPASGLAGGQSCHVTVRFTPAARGSRSGTLTITDNVAGSPQTVAITGTGTAPQVAFTPSAGLDFGSTQRAGNPGMVKNVTLTNTGDGQLTITSMTSDDPADFSVDGSACPRGPYTVAAGGSCTIVVTFAPTIAGPYGLNVPHTNLAAANLVVVDDAGSGTQKLPLSGLATGPGAQFSVANVTITGVGFGEQALNIPSDPMVVTLMNNGSDPLVISGVAMTGDFTENDSCGALPATLPAGTSCTLTITFTPSQLGKRSGGLTITDNAANTQQSITLSGFGVNVSGRRQGSGIHRELLTRPIVAIPIVPDAF